MIGQRRAAWLFIAAIIVLFVGCGASIVSAQDTPGAIRALEVGQPAPYTGMLIPDDELIAWRREIERLRFELVLHRQRADALRAADAVLADARARAGEERLALREELWTDRVATLTRERDRARAERGPRWWQRGALWLPVGLAAGIVTGALVATR